MKKMWALCGAVALLNACAAIPSTDDVVVARAGNLKETPAWATIEDSGYSCIISKDGTVKKGVASGGERYFCSLAMFNRPAKRATNLAQLMKAAEIDAKAAIVSSIETKLKENTEKAAEGFEGDTTVLTDAIAASSKGILRGIRVAKKYWEKKIVQSEDGQSYQYDVYVLTYISERDLQDSIDAMANKKKLSDEAKALLKNAGSYAFED